MQINCIIRLYFLLRVLVEFGTNVNSKYSGIEVFDMTKIIVDNLSLNSCTLVQNGIYLFY